MTVNEAIKILMDNKKGTVTIAYDYGDKFVLSIQNGRSFLDGLYSIDKKSKEIKEFSPFADMRKWREVCKNPVYRK